MLLRKIDPTSSVSRKQGSGQPRSVRTEANIDLVAGLIFSQENDPGTGEKSEGNRKGDQDIMQLSASHCSTRSSAESFQA